LFHGPTGTGKTSVAEQIAARCVMPFFRVSCHGQMEVSDLLGSKSIISEGGVSVTASNDTDVTLAAKHGGMLCLDEVFRLPPECLMSLQSLFEYPHKLSLLDAHGTDTVVDVPLNDFNLVLTDNTTGNGSSSGAYVANAQDQSTQNRIRRAILIDYLPRATEEALLLKVYPDIPSSMLAQMCRIASEVRSLFNNGDIQHTISIRELLSWCESLTHLRDMKKSFCYAYYDRLEEADKTPASDVYEQEFGVSLI
jgi:cobaltochelatase CobS